MIKVLSVTVCLLASAMFAHAEEFIAVKYQTIMYGSGDISYYVTPMESTLIEKAKTECDKIGMRATELSEVLVKLGSHFKILEANRATALFTHEIEYTATARCD